MAAPRAISLGLVGLVGHLLSSASATLAQPARTVSQLDPQWVASQKAHTGFVEAMKGLTQPEAKSHGSTPTAYVMIELPPASAEDERPLTVDFRAVTAAVLAQFYAQVCEQRGQPVTQFQCPGGKFTIISGEELPAAQACRFMEALL